MRTARTSRQAPRPKARLEKHEQADGVALLRQLGARVYVIGTRRPRGDTPGTMQTPGIPDVFAYLPRPRYAATTRWRTRSPLWWEVKRSAGGKVRAEQADFRLLSRDAGIDHVTGDLNALMSYLVTEGYLTANQLPHDRQPKAGQP